MGNSTRSTRSLHVLIAAGMLLAAAPGASGQATATSGDAAATAPETAPQSSGRDVEKVLADAVDAMGGHDLIDRIRTISVRSEMTGGGMSLTSATYWSRSGGRLVKRKLPGMPEMIVGYDGTVGWRRNPITSQYELLDEKSLNDVEEPHLHIKILQIDREDRQEFRSMRTVGRATLQGHDCWKVYFEDEDGQPGHLFFDAATRLPVGAVMTARDGGGTTAATLLFDDWKPLDGLNLFRRMTFADDRQTMEVEFVEITINDLENDFFAAPPEVKKLAAARPKASGEGGGGGLKLEDLPSDQQEQAKEMLDGFEQMPDAASLERAISSMDMAVGFAPPEQKKMFEYVVQEAKKRLAKLKGG